MCFAMSGAGWMSDEHNKSVPAAAQKVGPCHAEAQRYGIEDLKEIMTRLRDPETGCPWDQKQDFKSISPYTIEEAYEVVDAIDQGDRVALCDELGDLLFQVIYHAEMAREEQSFAFDDVVHAISAKLIRRHPHVFGTETLHSDDEIREMWERVKQEEKAGAGVEDGAACPSLLADVPVGLPGLTRALKLQKKAARVGFDWPSTTPVLEKLEEELEELRAELQAETLEGTAGPANKEKIAEEFGDMLFVMANLARHLRIDPEAALRGANEKFCRRFHHIEVELAGASKPLSEASLEEMEALWDEAKALEKGRS